MVSAVGDDEAGDKAIEELNAFGVSTLWMQVSTERPTGTVGVTLDRYGKAFL